MRFGAILLPHPTFIRHMKVDIQSVIDKEIHSG